MGCSVLSTRQPPSKTSERDPAESRRSLTPSMSLVSASVYPGRLQPWPVREHEGNDRATSLHPTQAEAAKAGREIARRDQTRFLLHGRDGRIRELSDYGKHHKHSHSSK